MAEEHLDYFRYKLLLSGYNMKEREIIIKEGRARYENLREQSATGRRPLYREACWKKQERDVAKKAKKINWYGKEVDTVIFVQSTPGEILKKKVEAIVSNAG